MSNDMRKLRRQVAWVCFDGYLSEEQLLKAIRILEYSFQMDSVSTLIAYINRICNEFAIDETVRKSLYGQFHKMMVNPPDSLIDPLPLLHKKEQYRPIVDQTPPAPPVIIVPAPSVEKVIKPPPVAVETVEISAHAGMFIYFMQQLVLYFPQANDFFLELNDLSNDPKAAPEIIRDLISDWLKDTDNFSWAHDSSEQQLADIVHLAYTAVCEILGPIAADDVFHKTLVKCEQNPKARQFSPARFL